MGSTRQQALAVALTWRFGATGQFSYTDMAGKLSDVTLRIMSIDDCPPGRESGNYADCRDGRDNDDE